MICQLGRKRGKKIAVAYFSNSEGISFGPDDVIITDASKKAVGSGQTDASTLVKAHKAGAKIYSHPALHAKIVCASDAAIVSLANLSQSSRKLREAGILVRGVGMIAEIQDYLTQLQNESEFLNMRKLTSLATIPVVRSGGMGPRSARPTLFEALEENSPMLDQVVFTWHDHGYEFTRKRVMSEACKNDCYLPRGEAWDWFESGYTKELLAKTCKFNGSPLIAWNVKLNKSDEILQFKAHDEIATIQIEAFKLEDCIISIIGTTPARIPFNLKPRRAELARILNIGIKKADARLRKEINNDLALISRRQLVQLFRLGQ